MSDPAPPVRPPGPPPDAAAPLTPAAVERVLADFRTWLTDLAAAPSPTAEPPTVDLHTVVAQFTALRHEVNLQTRAARTSLEQTGEALKQLEETVEELRERPEADDDESAPLLKAMIDVYDNLALALRQVERQRATIDQPLAECADEPDVLDLRGKALAPGPVVLRPSFWWMLFGRTAAKPAHGPEVDALLKEVDARRERRADAAKLVRSSFDGLIAGYRMSLARVDRAIEQAGLEPIATVGQPFDPELMEAVEVAGDTGRPAGQVVEEVRRGYLRGEVVFRYAQVKVAR
jgi:molecular chaperone GrpE